DQRVDDRIGDTHQIARAWRGSGGGTPVVALLVSGRLRLREDGGDDVEIEVPDPVDVLRLVDDLRICIDPELAQLLDEGTGDAEVRRIAAEKIDSQDLSVRIDQLGAAPGVARFL